MVAQYLSQRLETGYALKHGPGKRTVFSQAQKDIMVEFYNRQAVNRIRAEPRDVIKAMQDAGLEVLSATQIKSWWSTYHRKNRNLLANGLPAASDVPSRVPSATVSSSSVPSATVPSSTAPPATVPSSASSATVPSSSVPPATVPSSVAPATVPSSVPPATMLSSAPPSNVPFSATPVVLSSATVLPPVIPQAIVTGRLSQLSGAVIEWPFPEDFSQSTIDSRNGSNACAFISLYFGQVASKGLLPPSQGLALDVHWKDALREAMIRGNDLHDEMFDHEGINLNVDDAVEMAGEDCGVLCLGRQKDLFGGTGVTKQLLAEFLDELSGSNQRSCLLFFSSGRTMFLLVDSCGHFYFVDSHSHRDCGALIATAPPGNGVAFTEWIDRMMDFNWQTPLTLGSVTEVIYA